MPTLTVRITTAMLVATLAAPALSFAQASVQDFELGGSAYPLSSECIRLTPDQPYLSGSAWFKQAVDLTRPFEVKLDLVLGHKDQSGADGIVFVLHPTMRTGFRGEGMGFAGLIPSVGVEFDTYHNVHLNDPGVDHLALMTNGDSFHGGGNPSVVELGNLEDGARHPLRITWDPTAGDMKIWLDGALRATFSGDVVRGTFGGNPVLHWGMTAATGRLSNPQDICISHRFLGV